MLKIKRIALAAATLAFLGIPAAWAQVTVPHTFSAGTAAKASEVNANFQAILDALNTVGFTPIPADGSYGGLQYSTSATLAGRNVVVMRGFDEVAGVYRYTVRASYQNGTVNVNGTPTAFAYVRELGFVRSGAAGTELTGATVWRMGSNDLAADTWNTEVTAYAAAADLTASVATVDTDTQVDDYLCFNAAISGLVRHCRLKRTDGTSTLLLDDSRIVSLIATSFTAGPAPLTFPNGGVAGAYLSDNSSREWFLVAKDVGMVAESRRQGVKDSAGGDYTPNMVTFGVIYYRMNGAATGTVSGTMWATAANQIMFVP